MRRSYGPIRRFFWWCAVADPEVICDPRCPEANRLKYAIVGTFVSISALVATVGWAYHASLLFTDAPSEAAIALGILMGLLIFNLERLLIASIPARISAGGVVVALLWRSLLAGLAALIMTTPVALKHFHAAIIVKLDDERLQLMTNKRAEVKAFYDLDGVSKALKESDDALRKNREDWSRLPDSVQAAATRASGCSSEYAKLKQSLGRKIAEASAKRAEVQRISTINDPGWARVANLTRQINNWNADLIAKQKHCLALDSGFAAARDSYHSAIDSERQALLASRSHRVAELDSASAGTQSTLAKSDAIIAQHVAPGLNAQLRTLSNLVSTNPFDLAQLAVYFLFFYLVDLLPICAKLLSTSIYERLLGAREQVALANIEADVAAAQSQASIRAEWAEAELDGFRALSRDRAPFVEQAAVSLRYRVARQDIQTLFGRIDDVIAEIVKGHEKIDEFSNLRLHAGYDESYLAQIRSMLHEATLRATSAFAFENTAAANSNAATNSDSVRVHPRAV